MNRVVLSKSVRVLDRVGTVFGAIEFAQTDDDTGALVKSIRLTAEEWEDFGRPATLTVTLEPGDLLNG